MNFTAFRNDPRLKIALTKLKQPATRDVILQASGITRQDLERSMRNRAIAEGARSFEEGERVAARVSIFKAPQSRKESATRELLPELAGAAEAHGITVCTALSLALAYASCEE